jgi:hypothetical protein
VVPRDPNEKEEVLLGYAWSLEARENINIDALITSRVENLRGRLLKIIMDSIAL